MNNEHMNPLYKGRYLAAIAEGREEFLLYLEAGTILRYDNGYARVFFQLAEDYRYFLARITPLTPLEGSVILLSATDYKDYRITDPIYPDMVVIPADDEIEFYNKQNTV